jgi:lysozyme
MIPAMNISENGLKKLEEWEGEILHVYRDAAGLPTIGIGHLLTRSELMSGYITIGGKSVALANGITDEQSLILLDQDLDPVEHIVNKLVNVPLNQNQFDAIVAFTFNIGNGGFQSSSALKSINAGDFAAVPNAMKRWNKITDPKTKLKVVCDGLVSRRNKEVALFIS